MTHFVSCSCLIHGGGTGKKRSAVDHFAEDTAHGPDIHTKCIARGPQQNLCRTTILIPAHTTLLKYRVTWCSVPSRGNVISENRRRARRLGKRSTQAEITHLKTPSMTQRKIYTYIYCIRHLVYLDVTVTIQQDVAGLHVSVQQSRRMKIFQRLQQLPNNIFFVNIC